MNWDYPNPFTQALTVTADQIDGLQHTNNGVYVTWCGDLAWAHSTSLGLGIEEYQALDRAMAVREATYEYIQATREGERLILGTWITGWDQKLTMERRFQLISEDTGQTVLRAVMNFVCIAISSGRPKRMPPEFIAGYAPALTSP